MSVRLPDPLVVFDHLETDVLIIGAGPAGLSAASRLAGRHGLSVIVIERDIVAGGMPRWCGHSPFGMREFQRILSGDAYGDRLVANAEAAGAKILLRHTALSIKPDGAVIIASPKGPIEITARRILMATGLRETSRAGLMIGGERPQGVINTGALQYMVYRDGVPPPFRHPVIVGSELVSLSAILTLRSVGIKPVALIESERALRVSRPLGFFPRLLGINVLAGTELVAIHGARQVESIEVRGPDGTQTIACDGVVLTGRFTPEASLARMSGLAINPATLGPIIDPSARTTLAPVFAAGNMVGGVRTAGACWSDGRRLATNIAADLASSRS